MIMKTKSIATIATRTQIVIRIIIIIMVSFYFKSSLFYIINSSLYSSHQLRYSYVKMVETIIQEVVQEEEVVVQEEVVQEEEVVFLEEVVQEEEVVVLEEVAQEEEVVVLEEVVQVEVVQVEEVQAPSMMMNGINAMMKTVRMEILSPQHRLCLKITFLMTSHVGGVHLDNETMPQMEAILISMGHMVMLHSVWQELQQSFPSSYERWV